MKKSTFANLLYIPALISILFFTGCRENELQEEPLTFAFQITETTEQYVKVLVTPSSENSTWYAAAVEKATFEAWSSAAEFLKMVSSELRGRLNAGDSPLEILYSGTTDVTSAGLKPETDYIFYAVGMDQEMNPNSAMKSISFTTGEDTEMFEIVPDDITSWSASVQVIPDDPETGYHFGIADKTVIDSYESDQDYITALLQSKSIKINKGETFWSAEDLDPQTDYYAFAFGIEPDGTITTALHKKVFTTESVEMSGLTFNTETTLQYNTVQYTIKPSDSKNAYWYFLISEKEMSDYSPSEIFNKRIDDVISNYQTGTSHSDIFQEIAVYGEISGEETCTAEQKWYIIAGGINEYLQANSELSITEFTTGKAHLDYTINMSVSKVLARSVTVDIQFSGPMEFYYGIFAKEYIDNFSSDDELIAAIDFEKEGIHYLVKETTVYESGLNPGTDYCMVIIGWNEGPATAPAKAYFTTLNIDGDPSETTFDIQIKPYFSSAEVSIIPSSNTTKYVSGITTLQDFQESSQNDCPIETLLKLIYANDLSWGTSLSEILLWYAYEGSSYDTYRELASDTEYVIYAAAIHEDGNLAGDGTFKQFRTPERIVSNAAVEIINIKYFQMAELREEFPEASWWEGNNAYVVWELKPNSSTAQMYCKGYFWDDPSTYSQEELIEELLWYKTDQTLMKEVFSWDETAWIMSVGTDESGNFGEVTWLSVTPDITKSSPASEFPIELLDGFNSSAPTRYNAVKKESHESVPDKITPQMGSVEILSKHKVIPNKHLFVKIRRIDCHEK